MPKLMDLTGQRFGRWTVLNRAPNRIIGDYSCTYWNCRCDCGAVREVNRSALVQGKTQSCGCYAVEYSSTHNRREGTAFRNLFRVYKMGARVREIGFDLSEEQFKSLVMGDCFYCGCSPAQESICKGTKEKFVHNGIDRLAPEVGYVLENCVSACSQCNYMKQDYAREEFISKCKEIARRHA